MITDISTNEALHILSQNYVGHLAYIYENKPYSTPITYFYEKETKSILCFTAEGQKTRALRKNPAVSLQVSNIESITEWKSILAHGTFEELLDGVAQSKLHDFSMGIKNIILLKEHRKVDFISEFSRKIYEGKIPIVFRIHLKTITGKSRED